MTAFPSSSLIKRLACGLGAAWIAVAAPAPAIAQERWHHPFPGRDVYRFDHRHRSLWQDGMWRHGHHFGRNGWWWVTGGVWYRYDAPVYPYPGIVSELAVPAPPPVVVVPPAPVMAQPVPVPAPPPPQPQTPMWYYCDNPAGYYPHVPTCATPFRAVPARPN